ncbi:MAG TPA: hypothetical protein VH082_10820 [Rudaea sp.]|jgi:hypothetical protein|nr:hypothetical protein [Rudaea sp.]
MSSNDQWWVAAVGDVLVWARLRVLESGHVEVFDASGDTLRYDDEDNGRMALLDANFRAFDGLDEEDAAVMGFDLESVEPPRADSDDELMPLMTEKLTPGHA